MLIFQHTIRSALFRVCASVSTLVLSGCSLNDLVKVDPVSQQQVDADIVRTYSGSVALYYGAIKVAAIWTETHIRVTGMMTDELGCASGANTCDHGLNARSDWKFKAGDQNQPGAWALMAATQRAIDALRQFPDQAPRAYLSELYALQGMAVVWLAEAYCSGVPLTKTPLTGNFSYTQGYTTTEVLQHAVALFDTALTFGEDNLRIATLARVGKARALMNLNDYGAAAAVVTMVPTEELYVLYYRDGIQNNYLATNEGGMGVANAEGGNGLQWIAVSPVVQDPRVPLTTEEFGGTMLFTSPVQQAKYLGANSTIRLADGIEARLIEAEAALQARDPVRWAQLLNDLRASAIVPAIPALSTDSTLLADSTLRVNVMFRERAYWLYLTGHRQGDLRRLIRQYGRMAAAVYPSGQYQWPNTGLVLYDDFVALTPSDSEIDRNPLYDGCVNRNP